MSTPLANAIDHLRATPGDVPSPAALARRAGLPRDALEAMVRERYHLRAADLIARSRLDFAKTRLSERTAVDEIAHEAGFASTAALDRTCLRYLGLDALAFRRLTTAPAAGASREAFTLRLPRVSTTAIHGLLNRDPTAATEHVCRTPAGLSIARGFRASASAPACVVEIELSTNRARCRVRRLTSRQRPSAHDRLAAHALSVRLLGLRSEPGPLRSAVASTPATQWFAPLLAASGGLRVPLMASAYEALVWAILGQQVNLTFASQLRAELIRLAQPDGEAPCDRQLLAHPSPADVARIDPRDLRARRFSRSKAEWIVALSAAIAGGELPLEALAAGPADDAYAALVARKGIGDWTAQYVMLRGFGFNDCVPAADAGLMRHLQGILHLPTRPDAQGVRELLAPFAPARSLACQHVWSWPGDAQASTERAPASG